MVFPVPKKESMSLYRILLIEPNVELGRVLSDYFRRCDFDAVNVQNAQEALELARREMPDLIVAESELQGADGLAFARALRMDPDLEATPLVMLSSDPGPEQRLASLDSGANDYVLKPFSMRELVLRCQRQISYHRQAQPGELSGDISRFKTTDILQMLEANQATGVLHVEGERTGEIHLLDGYICGSFAGSYRGEEATYQLIPVRRGRFHFVRTNIRSNIQKVRSTTELMMEALRRHDEKDKEPASVDST
jgi:DNA-binding response OmpR family regulator